jgi:CO/xanthine dehydrogenase FAD-binding subunit
MTAARLTIANGRIEDAAISVGACAPVAVRLAEIEAGLRGMACDLAGDFIRDSRSGIRAALSPIDDVRGTAGYRRDAAAEIVVRLVERLCEDFG